MIKESNTRINLTLDKEFKQQLQELASWQGRSFNSLVIEALKSYTKELPGRETKNVYLVTLQGDAGQRMEKLFATGEKAIEYARKQKKSFGTEHWKIQLDLYSYSEQKQEYEFIDNIELGAD